VTAGTSVVRATDAPDAVGRDVAPVAAVRVALPPGTDLDPFALAGTEGVVVADGDRVLAGVGRARTVALPTGLDDPDGVDAAVAALAAVPCDDRVGPAVAGHPVVAFGALPFDRSAPTELVVPALTYGRESDGTAWVTIVGTAADRLPDADDPDTPAELARRLTPPTATATATTPDGSTPDDGAVGPVAVPRTADADFERSVADAVAAIRAGELVKVVLARTVDVRATGPVDVVALARRWARLEPACTVFGVPTRDGRFVGASPELLVERSGRRVHSRPLAGTTDRFHDASSGLPAELLESAKDGEEHRLVVEAIRDALDPVCDRLDVPDHPELVHLHTITHLGTTIDGTLGIGADGSVPSALHLVARLHPTPAVGGVPRGAAARWIGRMEPVARGTYAGPVGWVDGAGDGRWMVGIRAVTVAGPSVRMTAGVGIVADSDPHTELEETRLKLRAAFGAVAPGADLDAVTLAPATAEG